MKTHLAVLLLCAILFSCATEADVDPATGTFIRYFPSENSATAILAIESDDGYTMLSNLDIQAENNRFIKKIKLIHTDVDGNLKWESIYPSNESGANNEISMTGSSIITLNSGYLIVGDSIKGNRTDLLLLFIDRNGADPKTITISMDTETNTTRSLHGRAVIEDSDGGVIILAEIDGDPTNDTYLAKYSIAGDSIVWSHEYGGNTSSILNRLFSAPDQKLYWVGSFESQSTSDFRIVSAPRNSIPTLGKLLGEKEVDEHATDFCQALGGWVITGTTNRNGDNDIYYSKVTLASDTIFNKRIVMPQSNEEANSICEAQDYGLVILGTVESTQNQKDLYLTKSDVNGVQLWSYTYGGADDQVGASVRPLSDGGLLVFGTTTFGRSKKLMLLKVNRNGTL